MFYKFSKGKAIYSVPNGVGDGSAYFDGSGVYAVVSAIDNLPYGSSPRTISIWFYSKVYFSTPGTLFCYGRSTQNNLYGVGILMQSSNYCYVSTWGRSNTKDYKCSLSLGEWQHIVVTFDSDYQEKIYVNGQVVGTGTHSNINTIKDISCIGAFPYDGYYGGEILQGNIKDLNVYNRVLSTDEVTQLYNKQEITSGRVLHIPLQYGKDDESLFSSKNFVYDSSVVETSSGFNALGKPIGYRSASGAGINYNTIPTKGLIFYAPCETDANVKIGNQFTTLNSVEQKVAKDIPCLRFTEACRVSLDNSLFANNQITLSAWYYNVSTYFSGNILGYGSSNGALFLKEHNSAFNVANQSRDYSVGFTMSTDTWYHLVAVYSDKWIDVYVNGELIKSLNVEINLQNGTVCVGGGLEDGWWIKGYITKCRIYNRPLTEKEIRQLANEYKVV